MYTSLSLYIYIYTCRPRRLSKVAYRRRCQPPALVQPMPPAYLPAVPIYYINKNIYIYICIYIYIYIYYVCMSHIYIYICM